MRGADDTGGRVVVVVVGRVVDVVDEVVVVGRVVDVVDEVVVVGRVVDVVDVEVVDVEVVELVVELVVVELVVVVVGATAVTWWTYTSPCPFVSAGTNAAAVTKPAHVPSPLIAEPVDRRVAWLPAESTLARVVSPVDRLCTNTSRTPFVSPETRLVASDSNATLVPSRLIAGPSSALELLPFP
jgi:hypothetical protein